MAVGKESIKRAASSTTKKTTTRKTTAAKTKAAEVMTEAQVEVAEQAVADNAAKFMQTESVKENKNQPVRVTDKMPVHLL